MSLTAATRDNAPFDIQLNPDKYAAIGDLLNDAASGNEVGKPDVSELLVQTYGDQGITGFLKLTGAVTSAGSSDQLEFFEVGRRHKTYLYSSSANAASGEMNVPSAALTQGNGQGGEVPNDDTANTSDLVAGDILMDLGTGVRFIYKDFGSTAADDHTLIRMDGKDADGTSDFDASNGGTLAHIGNVYSQGSNQPTVFTQPEVKRRFNTYAITKDRFQVNGSQATNVGYVNVGNGDYRWFMYGEQEARKRFEDRREMIMLFGELNDHANANTLAVSTTGANGKFAGTEGYITALEEGGIKWADSAGIDALSDIDTIIAELDANGAPSEYAMYLDRDQSLKIDDMLAAGVATQVTAGLPGQFGAFDNNSDLAVQLGFKSFTRGGYTFHKHDFKLLNDPTLLGAASANYYKGVMCPLTTVADARTGVAAPALEMKYKASNGYSREMEHWVTGGGIMGHTNGDNGQDVMTFHYRSETALLTRARNQHVLITKS
jgi:hypothetical protein